MLDKKREKAYDEYTTRLAACEYFYRIFMEFYSA